MTRSKALLLWWFGAARREDPMLERFGMLKGCDAERPVKAVPVFFKRKPA
jgi:hypothetical protein